MNLTLKQIIQIVIAGILLSISLSLYSSTKIERMIHNSRDLANIQLQQLNQALELENEILKQRLVTFDYLGTQNPNHLEEGDRLFISLSKSITERLNKPQFFQIHQFYLQQKKILDQIRALHYDFRTSDAYLLIRTESKVKFEEIVTSFHQLNKEERERIQILLAQVESTGNHVMTVINITLITRLLAAFVTIFFLYWIRKQILRLKKDLINIQVTGDLSARLPLISQGGDLNEIVKVTNRFIAHRQKWSDTSKRTNETLQQTVRELQGAQKRLVEAEKMRSLGELVAGVAHEVNTPLGIAVTGVSHLLELEKKLEGSYQNGTMTSSQFKKYLKDSKEMGELTLSSLERASKLVSNFKKVAVDQSTYELSVFNVKEYINIVLGSLETLLKPINPEVTLHCEEDLLVNSHPGALAQILTNLVQNSLIHGFEREGQNKISIEIFKEQDGKDELIIEYADNGHGIQPELREKIFNPFFTTKRNQGGSGLGLHIIYNIISHQLGGNVSCHEGKHGGALFCLNFPVQFISKV